MDMDTYEMSNVDIFREMFIQVLTFHDAHGSSYSFLFASLEILSTFQFIYFLFSFFFQNHSEIAFNHYTNKFRQIKTEHRKDCTNKYG